MSRLFAMTLAAAGLLLLAPAVSNATPIQGQLNITGDAIVMPTILDYLCDILGQSCPGTAGIFSVGGAAVQSGDFTAVANTYGYIKDIGYPTPGTPVGQTFLLSDFMTFQADPNMHIDLTYIFPGNGGACPPSGSSVCTPSIPVDATYNPTGTSPFNLANTQTGASASFSILGQTRNNAGETAPLQGLFTAQFPGITVQDLLNELATTGKVTSSYSAAFTATTIPEPATTCLVIGGLLMMVGLSRKVRHDRE